MNLNELQSKIDKYNFAYYTTGNALVADHVYDDLKSELKKLNPNDIRLSSVGSSVRDSILQKKTHSIPMGSLDKIQNENDWKNWIKNTLIKNGLSSSTPLSASYKMDGGSISLTFKNGKLIEAISRGDGNTGEDITANALSFKGIPSNLDKNFSGYVRGEIVLTLDDWAKVDSDMSSNPRNQAVGVARRKDGSQSEYLTFYAFKIYNINGKIEAATEDEMFKKLKSLGFNTVEYFVGSSDEIWKFYIDTNKVRSCLNYWIDGLVVSINNMDKCLSLGESSNCPNGSIAMKFPAEKAKTTLLGVTFQVGNSGTICPVAKISPTRLGGSTIEFASLYNFDYIEELDLHINDEVELIKANDIIPQITKVLNVAVNRKKIHTPTNCPICQSKLVKKSNISGIDSVALYCVNSDCAAQVTGKIEKYVKSLNIQGVGLSVIEALVSQMNVKDAADLYILHNRRNELVDLVLSDKVQLGEKRADKILSEIQKKRKIPLNEFLGSLGIQGLGKRRVALIQEALSGKMESINNWFDDTLIKNSANSTIPNLATDITLEIKKKKDYILRFIKNGLTIAASTKSNLKDGALMFVLSGNFPEKKEYYHKLIEQSGNGYSETFSKSIDYLVVSDPNSQSSKTVKARKNGIKIIDQNELLKLL